MHVLPLEWETKLLSSIKLLLRLMCFCYTFLSLWQNFNNKSGEVEYSKNFREPDTRQGSARVQEVWCRDITGRFY